MPGSFLLEIVTPERQLYSGEVTSLQAPALDGLFGVLHNRAPLLAALGPGNITFQPEDEPGARFVAISGGFCEVARNRAVILADHAQFGSEIDPADAARQLDAARQELSKASSSEAEAIARQQDYATAQAKVKAAERSRH